MNPEKIKQQAKQLMDEFSKALAKIDSNAEFGQEQEKQLRTGEVSEFPGFREKMFRNAKKKTDDFIVAEKRTW